MKKENIPIIVGLGGYQAGGLEAFGDSAIGHYQLFHSSLWLENKENEIFKIAHAKMFPNDMPEENGILGYELGTIMVKALDATGGDPEDAEKIVNAIEKVDYMSPRGHIKMDPNHVANVPIYIFQVQKKDGKLVHKVVANTGNWSTPGGPDGPGGECKLGK